MPCLNGMGCLYACVPVGTGRMMPGVAWQNRAALLLFADVDFERWLAAAPLCRWTSGKRCPLGFLLLAAICQWLQAEDSRHPSVCLVEFVSGRVYRAASHGCVLYIARPAWPGCNISPEVSDVGQQMPQCFLIICTSCCLFAVAYGVAAACLIGFGCLKLITVDIVYSTWPCNMARHVCAARPWRARAPLPRPPCQLALYSLCQPLKKIAGYDNVHLFLHVLPFLLLEQRCILQAGLCLKPWTLPGGVRCNVNDFSISTLQE